MELRSPSPREILVEYVFVCVLCGKACEYVYVAPLGEQVHRPERCPHFSTADWKLKSKKTKVIE